MAKRYEDPILKKIIELLERDGPEGLVNGYGTSDPGVINKSQLKDPIAFVTYGDESPIRIGDSAAGEMRSSLPILINIVCDMTKDFGQGLNATAHMTAIELAIGRNPDHTIMKNSVVGALQRNRQISESLWIEVGSVIEVEPDAVRRDKGLVTSEILIRATLTHEQLQQEYLE